MVKRHFVIEFSSIGYVGGNYTSTAPYNAAKKAARMLFQHVKHGAEYEADSTKFAKYAKSAQYAKYKNVKKIKFSIRETTTDKVFAYEGTMTKLDEPKVISRNGTDVTIEKEIKIRACKLQE